MDNSTLNSNSPVEPIDRREARRLRRAERRASYGGFGGLAAGALLILLGIVFLMQNLGDFAIPINNWWALFILIPAIVALNNAWQAFQENGRWTGRALGSGLVGMMLIMVTVTFIVNLDWAIWGPVWIIVAGVGILFTTFFSRREN